jgi:hypothetical protein
LFFFCPAFCILQWMENLIVILFVVASSWHFWVNNFI